MAIVVGYRSEAVIGECLAALLTVPGLRVFVWDNSPDAATRAEIEKVGGGRVTVLSDGTNHGFGGGVNRAVAGALAVLADDDVSLIVVNPDCVVTPDVVDRLITRVGADDAGMVAPRMRYPDGRVGFAGGPWPSVLKEVAAATRLDDLLPVGLRNKIIAGGGRILGRRNTLADSLVEGVELEVDWVSGFCFAIRSELFTAVGGFDEDYFLYYEDVDLAHRVRARGFRNLVLRDVEALHYESTSTRGVGKSKIYWEGFATYCAKHKSRSAARIARLLTS
ncbi:dTDP-Rha:a-D-GlcNAc-diphosphoryl polyprenol, a-3 -L-rhamnosyl transferase [Mycolicibacterium canariasense]|uniref:dTDP-Rha:a-D-GlcNAc-diphosphoryl polyprenol, a-3-L-rhamnosyl transferase n=1 Tax=Mycolicibacterium canariasense TaxID=228230 RepID=A0A117I8S7_MYCCR|nr:glycosyltransferase family 2 protein [Mycolicibacterium canariasense]MCV7207514.1 glycosyltransferase family 2 protein [Mycolicibacterium canariasense]GAS93707.1 dTDP-Rha:a-D-GlcNAc-diphosphoryl polyprenol, a-3 -L-rhamnosyl transferase [Mycolicibacterium canariasense]